MKQTPTCLPGSFVRQPLDGKGACTTADITGTCTKTHPAPTHEPCP